LCRRYTKITFDNYFRDALANIRKERAYFIIIYMTLLFHKQTLGHFLNTNKFTYGSNNLSNNSALVKKDDGEWRLNGTINVTMIIRTYNFLLFTERINYQNKPVS